MILSLDKLGTKYACIVLLDIYDTALYTSLVSNGCVGNIT